MADEVGRTSEKPAGGGKLALGELRIEYSAEFPRVLESLHAALLVSTYQAGKVLVIGVHRGELTLASHRFDLPMGLAVGPRRIIIATRRQVFALYPAPQCANEAEPKGTHDGCWLARFSLVTGDVHAHEVAWGNEGVWLVNTLFSCLCTLHDSYSFVPRWKPPFISKLADDDRCHLNGLAIRDGQPRYVTAHAMSDEPAGWRPSKATSGCLLDVSTGQTVVDGLCMPHSPRWHDGRLWALDSGTGRLIIVQSGDGQVETVEHFPGYARGLSFRNGFALVGLSKIRETSVFGDIPLAEHRDKLRCGVAALDLAAGRTVAWLQFHAGVDEIFGVELLPGCLNPVLAGPSGAADGETPQQDIWIVPPET
jgi:protein O-GlcNAc transferase